MREIKFRVWDTKSESMEYEIAIGKGYGEDSYILFLGLGETFIIDDDIVKIMQYTGLKDKNGVEIYEGDIFTTLYITPMGDITDILSNEIYLVEFKNGMFGYSSKTKFNPLEDFIIKTKGEYISNCGCKTIYNETIIEVIGNIYEDSHLLDNN